MIWYRVESCFYGVLLCHPFINKKWQSNVIIHKTVSNVYLYMDMCMCISRHIWERFLPISIVFISKSSKVKASFSSKRHEKFSQIMRWCGPKKVQEAFSECVFQVWNGRIKANNYTEVNWLYEKQYIGTWLTNLYFKNGKHDPKSWLILLLPGR